MLRVISSERTVTDDRWWLILRLFKLCMPLLEEVSGCCKLSRPADCDLTSARLLHLLREGCAICHADDWEQTTANPPLLPPNQCVCTLRLAFPLWTCKKRCDPLPQHGRPVLSVPGHHSAQLVPGQRCSGCERPLPRRPERGRAAEAAHREGNVSDCREGPKTTCRCQYREYKSMNLIHRREHNRSVDDEDIYQQWVITMEPIYKNIFHFTRVGWCIFTSSPSQSQAAQALILFLFFQRMSVDSDSQVIPVAFSKLDLSFLRSSVQGTCVLLFSAVSHGCRCSSSLHHEALQQDVHLTEE